MESPLYLKIHPSSFLIPAVGQWIKYFTAEWKNSLGLCCVPVSVMYHQVSCN